MSISKAWKPVREEKKNFQLNLLNKLEDQVQKLIEKNLLP